MVYRRKPRRVIKKRNYIKKKSSSLDARIARVARKTILKKAEPKYKNHDHGHIELYHNTFTAFDLLESSQLPAQGSSQSTRVGDQINVGGILVRMLLGQKSDRPNVTWKYYIVSCDRAVSYLYGTFFKNLMNNVLLDSPNKDYIKVHKSGTIKKNGSPPTRIVSGDTTIKEFTYPFKIWLSYKKILKFGPNDGDQTHQGRKMFFLIAPFDAYGTLITDNIGYIDCTQTVYYKDP